MFPRKLTLTWKIDSSGKEELFLLVFILLDDKRKKKKMSKLGSWDISTAFSNVLLEFKPGDREHFFK